MTVYELVRLAMCLPSMFYVFLGVDNIITAIKYIIDCKLKDIRVIATMAVLFNPNNK